MTSVKEKEKTVEESLKNRSNKNSNQHRKKEIEEQERDLIKKVHKMIQGREKTARDQGST